MANRVRMPSFWWRWRQNCSKSVLRCDRVERDPPPRPLLHDANDRGICRPNVVRRPGHCAGADQRERQQPSTSGQTFDLVVYGGTAGGVITAVAAAREGLAVALLEPGRHLGGMVCGGLGLDRLRQKGSHRRLLARVLSSASARSTDVTIEWHFEPHVAEAVFNDLIKEAGVRVFLRTPASRKDGGRKDRDARVTEIVTENGGMFRARVFADTSYEGDLMAQARRDVHVGTRGHQRIQRVARRRSRSHATASVQSGGITGRFSRQAAARDHAAIDRIRSAPLTSASRPTTSVSA